MFGLQDLLLVGVGLTLVCVPIVKWAINIIKNEIPKFHFFKGAKTTHG